MKDSILHSTLTKKSFVLLGSDMVSNEGLINGNAVSLMLNCPNEKEIRACYEKLSREGKKIIRSGSASGVLCLADSQTNTGITGYFI